MAEALAENKDELARYVKLTLPDVPIVKVLEGKKLPDTKKLPEGKK